MNPHKEWFDSCKVYDGGEIFLGDNHMSTIIFKVKVKFYFSDGRIKSLDNVARNLLSMSKLNDFIKHVIFDMSSCRLVRGGLVIAKRS